MPNIVEFQTTELPFTALHCKGKGCGLSCVSPRARKAHDPPSLRISSCLYDLSPFPLFIALVALSSLLFSGVAQPELQAVFFLNAFLMSCWVIPTHYCHLIAYRLIDLEL